MRSIRAELVLVHLLLISMVRVVEHSHHDDDVEMTEGVASSVPHASCLPALGATMPVEQPPLAATVKGPLTNCERRSTGGS